METVPAIFQSGYPDWSDGSWAYRGYVATHFAQMGYQVSGWARSKKNLHRVQSFAGNEELDGF